MIIQQGTVNTTALIVPGLYVQIVPPKTTLINGVPTNIVGMVGTATWGPVGQPVIVSNMADYARAFGPVQPRKYDMGTQVATAVLQGANNFRCVRVTDGTEAYAAVQILTNCLILTARYPGTLGNSIIASVSGGQTAGTFRITVALPGLQPEVYDNLSGTGNAFWTNAQNAINNGQGPLRGPSQLVTAQADVGTTAPAIATYTLGATVQGSDGVAGVIAASLVGIDTVPRSGMYALRGLKCSIGVLADVDDATQWSTQSAFGLQEGVYMITVAPAGSAIQNGSNGSVDLDAASGIASYSCKMLHGDWLWWSDQANGLTRLVSPQGFVAGRLANLSPEQSSLNKPIYGISGSQKSGLPGSGQVTVYSQAELATLFLPGIDVVMNPMPGGNFWGCGLGHNSSSNPATSGDNYTRLTNYIAATLNTGMGVYVGDLITDDLFASIRATLLSFLQNLNGQGILPTPPGGGSPFSVICDASNNPDSRTELGYVQADCQIRYGAINEKFIVNMEAGQTVTIQRQTLPGQPLSV
jgi:hypothetical protein